MTRSLRECTCAPVPQCKCPTSGRSIPHHHTLPPKHRICVVHAFMRPPGWDVSCGRRRRRRRCCTGRPATLPSSSAAAATAGASPSGLSSTATAATSARPTGHCRCHRRVQLAFQSAASSSIDSSNVYDHRERRAVTGGHEMRWTQGALMLLVISVSGESGAPRASVPAGHQTASNCECHEYLNVSITPTCGHVSLLRCLNTAFTISLHFL